MAAACVALAVRMYHPAVVQKLAEQWQRATPDIVVSVAPNLNRAIACSLKKWSSNVPFLTILTDLADTPPHFWIERESQYLACGTERAVEQALAMGHALDRVFLMSGMVLHPRFYQTKTENRAHQRAQLGLQRNLTTVLVMFGGEGSTDILRIAKALNRTHLGMQVIYVCGKSEEVRNTLEKMDSRVPRLIVGFTKEVPAFMTASDVMIGKPGPGTISEALQFDLPVIVCRNGATMPQEVYNTEWVEQRGVGVVVRNFSKIDAVLEQLITSGRLGRLRENASRIRNRAIFEMEPLLLDILARHGADTIPDQRQDTAWYKETSSSANVRSSDSESPSVSQKRSAAVS
jgi:1,2-diacylglycerol 3-beta-galactosyltransferase